MTTQEQLSRFDNLLVLSIPINLIIELSVQFISLLMPITVSLKALSTGNILFVTSAILFALYVYPLTILVLGAVLTRLLPKPRLGYLDTSGERLKYQTLIALNTLIRRTSARGFLMLPFSHLFYRLSGTRIGDGTIITFPDSLPDAYLVSIGKNSLLGWECLVLGHYVPEPSKVFLGSVEIGDEVLIGAKAIIWPNVKIGDRSIIQNSSVVSPGTIIPSDEVWGGIPARKIKNISYTDVNQDSSQNVNEIKEYIAQFLATNHSINYSAHNVSLLSLGLSATDITRLLHTLEKKYNLFIDRTRINLVEYSIEDLIASIIDDSKT